jgi:hypothetical protein
MFVPHRKHAYGPPRPIMGESFILFIFRWCSYLTGSTHTCLHNFKEMSWPYLCRWCSYLTGNTHTNSHDLLWGKALFFPYLDDVRTSQEAHIRVSTTLRRFIELIYVDDVRTSQETRIRTPTTYYGGKALFFIFKWCSYLTGITHTCLYNFREMCLPYLCSWCSYLTGNTHSGLHSLSWGYLYLLFVDVRTPEERRIRATTTCYGV